jgi:hypothetical protein
MRDVASVSLLLAIFTLGLALFGATAPPPGPPDAGMVRNLDVSALQAALGCLADGGDLLVHADGGCQCIDGSR